MSEFADHLRRVGEDVRSGPLDDMRAACLLTPADLRRGAERAEADARFRRALADRMEREGTPMMTVHAVAALRRHQSP